MKRPLFAAFSILGPSLARAADIATTHHFSPDLALEGNGVVTAAGLGWPEIIAVNVLVVICLGLCTIYWWRVPLRYVPAASDDPWSLASFNYFGRILPARSFLWRFSLSWPGDWRMFTQFVGVVVPSLVTAASALAVFSWFALHQWRWAAYRTLYRHFFPCFPYAMLLPLYCVLLAGFVRSEWLRFHASPHSGGPGLGKPASV